jgi:hypothetical protein
LGCQTKANAEDNAVVIQGRLNLTAYEPSGGIFTNLNFGFEVSLQDNRWLIKTIYNPGTYFLTGYDGTNVYDYFVDASFTPPPAHASLTNHLSGTICAGSIPLNNNVYTMCPWFAFCSGSLFAERKAGDLIPAPWGAPRVFAIDSIFEPEVAVFDGVPHLPKECQFRVSDLLKTKILATNWADLADKDEMRLQFKPYHEGFLGGVYRVIATTNFAGFEIPLEFDCKRFIPADKSALFKPSGNSNSWLGQEIKGTVESISMRYLDSTQPPIPAGKQIDVSDMRLRDLQARVNGFGYAITNGIWPVEVAQGVARKFEDRRHVPILPTSTLPNVPVRRRAVWVVILLLTVAPVVFLFLFRKKL